MSEAATVTLARRALPLSAIALLALVVAMSLLRARPGETFDGLIVMNQWQFEFYPGVPSCPPRGLPYYMPNAPALSAFSFSFSLGGGDTTDQILNAKGAWHVRLRGDLSRVGRYGPGKRYWRQLVVTEVYRATRIDCDLK